MPKVGAIACLVWIGGLLLALLLDDAPQPLDWLIDGLQNQAIPVVKEIFRGIKLNYARCLISVVILCISSGLAAFFVPKYWRRGPKPVFYLLMGLLALWAALYYQLRSPQPSEIKIGDISEIANFHNIGDISRILSKHYFLQKEKEKEKLISEGQKNSKRIVTEKKITKDQKNPEQTVAGELISQGKMDSNGKIQFLLKTEFIKPNSELPVQDVTGNIYLTLPKEIGKNFSECQRLRITGQLFPLPRNRHSGFFNSSPPNQDIFANLKGKNVDLIGQDFCLIPQWRSRIVQSQSQWLPNSEIGNKQEGLLISSIVLGQKAVSLPQELRDLFSRVGLSHILAASGYQVSLLVGTTLRLTQNLSRKGRFVLGMSVLLIYLGLTGLQPSVVRASLMWTAILLGDLSERHVRPLGALLVAATLMLIFNPHWISDLGFQLSFLATFGILVSAPYFEQKFSFLPPKIAEIIAVPLAASLWTLPLLLSQFSQFVAVALPLNILVTPLVEMISFGGILSAIAALIYPDLGSAIAFLLYYPTTWLIQMAESASHFPILMVGQVHLLLLITIYLGMILIWLMPWWQKRWHFVTIFVISCLLISLIYQQLTTVKVTIFDKKTQAIFVIQEGLKTTIIEDGKSETKEFLLKPFLANSGIDINQVSCRWIPFDSKSSNCSSLKWLSHDPPVLRLIFKNQHWWFFLKRNSLYFPKLPSTEMKPNIVVWVGQFPYEIWLEDLPNYVGTYPVPRLTNRSTAIAITDSVSGKLRRRMKAKGIELYVTGEDGPIQWTSDKGFQSAIAFPESQ